MEFIIHATASVLQNLGNLKCLFKKFVILNELSISPNKPEHPVKAQTYNQIVGSVDYSSFFGLGIFLVLLKLQLVISCFL